MSFTGNIYLYVTGLGLVIGIIYDHLLYGLLIGAGIGGVSQYLFNNRNKST